MGTIGRHDLLRVPKAQQKLLKELRAFAETTKHDFAKAESNRKDLEGLNVAIIRALPEDDKVRIIELAESQSGPEKAVISRAHLSSGSLFHRDSLSSRGA